MIESKPTSFVDLPPEILLNIFRYINVRTLYGEVILICKYFHEVLTSEGIWKALFALKWEEHRFVQDIPYICSWNKVYLTFEDIDTHWKCGKPAGQLKTRKLAGHIGTVDAVHIMPSRQIFVSGSRDRNALVWKIDDLVESNLENTPPLPEVLQHNGWVWAIGSDPCKENEIVTSSWDKTVKLWDLQTLTLVNTYDHHPAPILSLCCENHVITTGCFDKKVRRLDTRSGDVVLETSYHKRAVLSLQMTDKYIFSGSEDQTIGIFDIRAGKLLTKLRLDSAALCMNMGTDQGLNYLRVGGKNGSLYIFDISNDSRFSCLNTFDLWSESKKVTAITNYRGCLMACSEGGSIRAYSPDRHCKFEKKFDDIHNNSGVTSCSSNGNLMLTGGEDCAVLVWKFAC